MQNPPLPNPNSKRSLTAALKKTPTIPNAAKPKSSRSTKKSSAVSREGGCATCYCRSSRSGLSRNLFNIINQLRQRLFPGFAPRSRPSQTCRHRLDKLPEHEMRLGHPGFVVKGPDRAASLFLHPGFRASNLFQEPDRHPPELPPELRAEHAPVLPIVIFYSQWLMVPTCPTLNHRAKTPSPQTETRMR